MSDFQPKRVDNPTLQDDPLRVALHDVVVPEGLESRLLRFLESKPTHVVEPKKVVEPTNGRGAWLSRRRWLMGTVASAGGMLAGYRWLHRELTSIEVAKAANIWLVEFDPPRWRPVDSPVKLPVLRNAVGWDQFVSEFSRSTIVYDLSSPASPNSVRLFVIPTTRNVDPIPVAPALFSSTGAWSNLAVFRTRKQVYVLAWTGARSDLRALLHGEPETDFLI